MPVLPRIRHLKMRKKKNINCFYALVWNNSHSKTVDIDLFNKSKEKINAIVIFFETKNWQIEKKVDWKNKLKQLVHFMGISSWLGS